MPPKPPGFIFQTELEANRISGDENIVPDDVTNAEIRRADETLLVTLVRVCLGETGKVKLVGILASSGFAAYDLTIKNTIATTWTFKPFMVNGVAARVCASITLTYDQRDADATP